jgi:GDP-L-fucose synthase
MILRKSVGHRGVTMSVFNMRDKRVWVAGHNGLVGSALVRRLSQENCEIQTVNRDQVDLCDSAKVNSWIRKNRPEAIFIAAAKVGGIQANRTLPADFIYNNLMIASNIVKYAHDYRVEKLLFLGSSCIYPKFAVQPLVENALLTGSLEPTNEWYAVAKIAGIKLCQAFRRQFGDDFISVMPTNLYGPGDNYDLESSHVVPALLRKIDSAKRNNDTHTVVWGTGQALREFMHVDDLADACIFLMKEYSDSEPINVGSGHEISIGDLARLIAEIVGFEGELVFDSAMPDGTPRKLLDSSKLARLGWTGHYNLRDGLRSAYEAFLNERCPPAPVRRRA